MTDKLPSVRPREVVAAFEKAGWRVHRQRGSHLVMVKPGRSRILVIPMHNRDIPTWTLRGILGDAELPIEEFIDFLRR